jgi:putative endonuclease
MNKQETGKIGEKLAVGFLKKRKFRVVATNYRCRTGEIDIIAENKKSLIFIEVRTKTSSEYGSPEESITAYKKNKLITTALTYLDEQQQTDVFWRIDFIAVDLDENGKLKRIEHIENVIS